MKKHISLIALTLSLLCNLNVAQSTAENRKTLSNLLDSKLSSIEAGPQTTQTVTSTSPSVSSK